KWAQDTFGTGDYTVVTLKNSFHGRTITTLAATGQDVFHKDFNPFPGGFAYATANDLESVEKCFAENKVCAVLMELVQGEGGVMSLDESFVKGVESLCRKKNALLMIDEVQTGNGRTGSLYAFQDYGISPDVVTTAKGLGGGLPIGAALLFDRVENTLGAGSHGSTFGGNPIAAAGAVSIIERIDEELLAGVRERSKYVFSSLCGAAGVKSVSGKGLMIGVELEKDVNEVLAACFEMGVLPIKAKNKLRLLPALNIPMELLKRAVAVIKAAAKGERI
ncbi:MAG: aminotransferase class III-fold pyridoxal phosphate-dependent enzyme, partial [Clostridia bacterium]|nr:aminotransferase class III-fold pyridoxal phosphate-dependent enzyme [Clostridia bacterium]